MIKLMMKVIFVLSLAVSLNVQAAALSGDDITSLFSGKTASCIKSKDQSTCLTFMSSDGKVKRLTNADGKTRLGTWNVTNNQLCILWAKKKKDLCFDVVKQNDTEYLLNRKGKTKSIINGFSDGDTI